MRLVMLVICCCTGLIWPASLTQEAQPLPAKIYRLESKLLPNLLSIDDRVFSGGQPEGDAAFEELSKRGIRTLISVDAARPNVEAASKHGLRYVHLPHGYDGISAERAKDLAKALQSLQGPVYIHCHHGKHRSPAATAVACKGLGWLQPADAMRLLKLAGTDARYKGLYRSVDAARQLSEGELKGIATDFPSIAQLAPMAELMVEIEHLYGDLLALQEQRWVITDRQELYSQQAVLLVEQFRELTRIDDPRSRTANFIKMSRATEQAANLLERELTSLERNHVTSIIRLDRAMAEIGENCKACHQLVRN